MIANLGTVIKAVDPGAVGSFNILDLDMALAVLDAADETGIPAVIGIAARHYSAIQAPRLIPSLQRAIESCSQPVALHLDHAAPDELDLVREALDAGFTSIMVDGSRLPLAENIAITRKVVELCRPYGVDVEGELGAIAGQEGSANTVGSGQDLPYTDPEEARAFADETGVGALAIAVGTAHGLYKHEPHIDLATISRIAALIDTPLVMHGASGVPDAMIRQSIASGIRKINFFSGLLKAGMDHVRNHFAARHNDYLYFKQGLCRRWQQIIAAQMQLYICEQGGAVAITNDNAS